MSAPKDHPEIIIIRRNRGRHHDGHHGGVWKIAYADFVTAMMAFFLVMWLINASNEETKAAVASYFNPVKLMDTTSNPKGVKDARYGASSQDQAVPDEDRARSDAVPETAKPVGEEEKALQIDETIFRDPYAVLSEIAGGEGAGPEAADASGKGVEDAVPRPGMKGGEAFRDPFEPEFWAEQRAEDHAAPQDGAAAEAGDAPAREDAAQLAEQALSEAARTAPPATPEAAPEAAPPPSSDAAALAAALDAGTASAPRVSVTEGDGTLTIDMTDGADFSMFELGSARPKKEVIALMAKIADALAGRDGAIEISGHTDARPFKGGGYDNWRLSSARAQMAYHMLVRAGIPEGRIRAVTGHADRLPKVAADPLDPANRRIEIRLVSDGALPAP